MRFLKNFTLSTFCFLFLYSAGMANDGKDLIYLNDKMEIVKGKSKAFYYSQMESGVVGAYFFKVFFMTGELKIEGYYKDEEMQVPNGPFIYYYQSGKVESKGNFEDGVKTGVWQRFDENGKELPERVYSGFKVSDIVYSRAEVMPEFVGGTAAMQKYIDENMYYPPKALAAKEEGTVEVMFIVNAEGKVENVHLYSGINPLLDAEAVRLIKDMPTWVPGQEGGKEVKVEMRVPIDFRVK